MRRLEAVDWAILLVLVPLYCGVFALHVREASRTGSAQVPVFAEPARGADAYPTVGGFRLERESGGTGLEVGDRLLRAGDVDLRGVGYFGFDAIAFEQAGAGLELPLVYERGGERFERVITLRPSELPWNRLPFSLALACVAVLVLLRAPGSHATRFFAFSFLLFAISETPFEGSSRIQTYAAYLVFYAGVPLATFCLLRWFILFPEEVDQRHRLPTALSWVAGLFLLARASYLFGGPLPSHLVPQAVLASDAILLATALFIVNWNYSKADPIGRRRLKWVLLGAYFTAVPVILNLFEPFVDLDFVRYDQLLNFSFLFGLMLPLGVVIAILRCRLFDIDRIIGTTVSYSALAAVLIGALATVIPALARALSAATGLGADTGQVALSALLAAGAVPAHRWLRPQIDRLFFSERHTLETGIRALLSELSSCTGANELIQRVGERLAESLRPESCTVFSRLEDNYAPIFVRGQSLPPEVPARSPLIAALEQLDTVAVAGGGRRGSELGPFERAALETLGVSVVVPIRPGGKLAAFLCLGDKRSGDIYTQTDLALLAAVGEKAAAEMLRYEDAELVRHERALQSELRRYVPGAIADQIDSGGDLEAREREVSVLFVDIRGYTTFSEGREAREVFSVINRYTEAVSSLVHENGGSVVEFNGDGMMVVFGAPQELPNKERAAVEAACKIVDAMTSVSTEDGTEAVPLAVGVGIATGPALVGNIRAVDRMIWSAIGNTTNLAARLQSLSRDLGASVVIDAATWEAAGAARRGFQRNAGTRIRGRSQAQDVYSLPLEL